MCNNLDPSDVIVQGTGILSTSGRCDALVFDGATMRWLTCSEETTEPRRRQQCSADDRITIYFDKQSLASGRLVITYDDYDFDICVTVHH